MRAEEIRNVFLEFFREKGHKIVPSAPIVVKNDPTLLFTNAGMNQFKDYFLGNKQVDIPRIADTQKCLRVSGKHNDLEEVGIDTYHHTMFEMLGNWSFGDYFKKEAIEWAWELLTERYKLPKDRLYVTIFEGDASENLEKDTEAYSYWKPLIDAERIIPSTKKDNFWEMGDTGPCGPCSEIHFDLRSDEERAQIPGEQLVNKDHPQVIEIWNLVFIQFNRKSDGLLENLPDKHVDTGMGFERLTRVLQRKSSNYDTDIFQPVIHRLAVDFKYEYGTNEKNDIACRVIADHIRAVVFTIADGQLPSNTGAGYVIRRILRRAVRYGYSFLGMEEPYIYKLVTVLAQQFQNIFPEVIKQEDFIKKVIQEEEASFLRTLASGTKLFEKNVKQGAKVSGKFAFELYDTYGFPFDLTQLMVREYGATIDEKGFREELQAQKNRSRADAAKEEGDWKVIIPDAGQTEFIGYDATESGLKLVRYREVSQKGKTIIQAVFNRTPFYPEGGGQVGDTGFIITDNAKIRVLDTFKENDLIIHVLEKLPDDIKADFTGIVDEAKRLETANNHTATHLLHAALRKVLGAHVAQKGSLVHSEGLRFDFSHFSKMTDEEISKVEALVNRKIRENIVLEEDRCVPIETAMQKGAMALFGEKYGDTVRTITFDPSYSIELCGGIHASSTGNLGFFKILSEGAVAAGVRRIEAVTGKQAEEFVNSQLDIIKDLKEFLKAPKDILSAVKQLKENQKLLEQDLEQFRLQQVKQIKDKLIVKSQQLNGAQLISEVIELDSADMGKNLVFNLRDQMKNGIVLLGAAVADKANLWLSIPEEFVSKYDINAGQIIREISKEIDGGGGGQAFFASAGGKEPKGLQKAIEKGREILINKINS